MALVTVYSYSQLEGLWDEAGGPSSVAPTMAAVAEAESGGRSDNNNYNDSNGRGGTQTSWGLWQISDGTHNMPVANIDDPLVNARAAVAKYRASGFSPWGTYTSGAYRQFLQGNVPPTSPGVTSSGNLALNSQTTGVTTTASNPVVDGISNFIEGLLGIPNANGLAGSSSDLLERLGLILLGALLVLVGVYMLAGRQALQLTPLGRFTPEGRENERREGNRRERVERAGRAEQRADRTLTIRERRQNLAEQVEKRKTASGPATPGRKKRTI